MEISILNSTRREKQSYRSARHLDELVYEIMKEGAPLTAYEITQRCCESGSRLTAMQAYRVLQRLILRRALIRVESLKAYVLAPDRDDCLVICRRCRSIETISVPDRMFALSELCRTKGFQMSMPIVEASGICKPCQLL